MSCSVADVNRDISEDPSNIGLQDVTFHKPAAFVRQKLGIYYEYMKPPFSTFKA
jgi:hypothetical protein